MVAARLAQSGRIGRVERATFGTWFGSLVGSRVGRAGSRSGRDRSRRPSRLRSTTHSTRDEHGQLWLDCDVDRRQPVSAAADVRRSGDRRSGGQHPHARHFAAAGRPPRRRGLSTDRRRAPAARRPGRRLAASAGADSRRRRSPDGRAGHRRKRPAQRPQRDRKGRVVPAVHRSISMHAGRAGRPRATSTARPWPI